MENKQTNKHTDPGLDSSFITPGLWALQEKQSSFIYEMQNTVFVLHGFWKY